MAQVTVWVKPETLASLRRGAASSQEQHGAELRDLLSEVGISLAPADLETSSFTVGLPEDRVDALLERLKQCPGCETAYRKPEDELP